MAEKHRPLLASSPPATGADAAVQNLTLDILRGTLGPNEKLRVKELTVRYGISASPMREALSRLSGGALVQLEGQKGFRVAPLAAEDLDDVTRTRQLVEPEALALSMDTADENWEAELIKSFHLLSREVERRASGSPEWLDVFEARHHDFHRSLIAACPLESLKTFCDSLYLRAERYRRVMFGYAFEQRDVIEEHGNLLAAALSGNVKLAQETLIRHIALTTDILAKLLPEKMAVSAQSRRPRSRVAKGAKAS